MRVVRDGQPARQPRFGRLARLLLTTLLLVAGMLAAQAVLASAARADAPHIDTVTFNQDVDPGSAQFLTDAIATAEGDGATLLVINEDTPGGDLDSMQTIVQAELASTVPIVMYISPAGAHAGSAGTFIALAAPIVAMAPDTRIGAASPVDSTGNDLPATLDRKVKNDLESQITGLQNTFHRNAKLAVQTVETAASYDDQDAINQDLVNIGVASQADLLGKLDNTTWTLANGTSVTLRTVDLPVTTLQETVGDQIKTVLVNPTVLFILFVVAAICIYLELAHPGAIVPGTVGAIALVVFLLGAGALNPNWSGLVLMLLAIVLLAVDVRVPTHGVLTVGALICLVVGSLIFFNSGVNPGAQTVSPIIVGAFAAGVGIVSAVLIQYVVRISRRRVATGSSGLIGVKAVVIAPLAPRGRVKVLGEDWAARLPERALVPGRQVEAHAAVRVIGVDGLTLIVEPIPHGAPPVQPSQSAPPPLVEQPARAPRASQPLSSQVPLPPLPPGP